MDNDLNWCSSSSTSDKTSHEIFNGPGTMLENLIQSSYMYTALNYNNHLKAQVLYIVR